MDSCYFFFMDILLNGGPAYFYAYCYSDRNEILCRLNDIARENIGLFCLEKSALKRYLKLSKKLGKFERETIKSYTYACDIEKILRDPKKKKFYLESFISQILDKCDKKNDFKVNSMFYLFNVKDFIKYLFTSINHYINNIDDLVIPYDSKGLEDALKYLIHTDYSDRCYEFINLYYRKKGVNLLGLAQTNIVKFPLERRK